MNLYSESNSENVFQHISKKALPKEFGGENGSIDVIAGKYKYNKESVIYLLLINIMVFQHTGKRKLKVTENGLWRMLIIVLLRS